MADVDRRVEELEVRVAFQEKLLADLDDVLRAVRDEMEVLRSALHNLTAEVAKSNADEPVDPEAERPPHY